jgi:hypothetical protein
MELIERPNMNAVNYLANIKYNKFKADCIQSALDKKERRPTEQDMKGWYSTLQQFIKTNIKTKGHTKRIYAYSQNTPAGLGGRLFSSGSLQSIWSVYRGALMRDIGTDIDMSNCHATILRYVCKKHNILCSNLEYYINNRDHCLAQFSSRGEGKNAFIVSTNNDKPLRGSHPICLKEYDKEMKRIQKKLIDLPDYKNLAETIPEYKLTHNYNGSYINRILSYYENIILQYIIHIINTKGIEIAILMFDGLMVYGNYYDNPELLQEIEAYIESQMEGLNMKLAYKEHNDELVIPDDYEKPKANIVVNDEECALYIIDKLDGKLIYTKSGIFYKNNNVWTNDIQNIENMLLKYIMENAPPNDNDCYLYKQYKNVKSVIKTILGLISQNDTGDDIYEKFHSITKGRVAFKDGVLCARTDKFYKWEEIDFEYYTTICINRDFQHYLDKPNFELMKTIEDTVFKPLFSSQCETALQFMSRGLFGHSEDKNWATFVGNRNSGKGVMYELLENAFGNYVGSFKIDNILTKGDDNGKETSRDLYWLIEMEFMRLAISQETPPENKKYKISAPLIKKICSGGDTQIARRNYDRRDTHFKTDTTIFCMGNDNLQCSTNDCNERRFQFNSLIQFMNKDEIEELKKKGLPQDIIDTRFGTIDYTLKDKCKTEEWCNAFVLLILKHYKEEPLSVSIIDIEEEENPLICKIHKLFDITTDKKDILLVSEVNKLFEDETKKLWNELKALGIVKNRCKARGVYRDKECYFGIKLKTENDDETDDEEL